MASIESLRADSTTPPAASPPLSLEAFRAGEERDRLTGLLAFALAVEAGSAGGQDQVERFRRRADAELHDHAFRLLHNRVEEIRREAVAEQLTKLGRPVGFWGVFAACLLAVLAAGAAGAWLLGQAGLPGPFLGAVLGG